MSRRWILILLASSTLLALIAGIQGCGAAHEPERPLPAAPETRARYQVVSFASSAIKVDSVTGETWCLTIQADGVAWYPIPTRGETGVRP